MNTQTFATVGQSIAWHAAYTPGKIAVVRQGGSVTYRRLARDLTRCVQALRDRYVGPGMLIGSSLSHRYTHLLIEMACELIGATVAPVLTKADDIVAHCHVVFTDPTGRLAPGPNIVSLPPDWLLRTRVPAGDTPLEREIPADQIVRIVRSSGTSGKAKSIPMSYATRQCRLRKTIDRVAGEILPDPRLLCAYPLNVGWADVRVLGVLQHGGTVFLAAKSDVAGLITSGAVNYALFLVGEVDAVIDSGVAPPRSGKVCVEVFGDTVAGPMRERIRRQFKSEIWNTFASSETNVVAVIDDDSVGTVERGIEVRLVDDFGREVEPGQQGRVQVRGDTVVSGYFKAPELTAASFIDGWFQMNDLAHMIAPGKMKLLGRADGVLNIAGVKIPGAPIEERIRQVAGISDAVLLRMRDDDDVGTLLVAVETANPSVAEITEMIRPILARYPITYSVMTATSFPRTRTGKVQRHEIEASFTADQIAVPA